MWVLLGQVASASASLVGVRLLTEFTRPEVFGEVNLWLGLALLGRDLFCMPLVQATLRFYAEVAGIDEVARLRHLVSRVLVWTTGLLVLVCLGGGDLQFLEPRLVPGLRRSRRVDHRRRGQEP